MLVLSRSPGESLALMGGFINVTYVEYRGRKARLGIDSHPSVSIVRSELLEDWRTPHRNVESAAALLRMVALTNEDPLIEQAIALLDEAGKDAAYVDAR